MSIVVIDSEISSGLVNGEYIINNNVSSVWCYIGIQIFSILNMWEGSIDLSHQNPIDYAVGWDWHQYREYIDEETTVNYKKGWMNIGIIYKITNKLNNKIYIGMTKRTLEQRKADHLKAYKDQNKRDYNYKIYKSFRKYGIDNFEFSVVEQCKDNELGEKEKYYINKFNTILDGYNEALGGEGKPLWTDKQIEACKILYENGWLLKEISDLFKSNPSTVGRKLKEKYGINTKENANKMNCRQIIAINKNERLKFDSVSIAAKYVVENNLSKTQKVRTAISKISEVIGTNKFRYGFKWFLNSDNG